MKKLVVLAFAAAAFAALAQSGYQGAQNVAEDLQKISAAQEQQRVEQRRREQLAASPTRERENPPWALLLIVPIAGLVLVAMRKK